MTRMKYIVTGIGFVACGLLLLYALQRRDWPSFPARGPAFTIYNESGLLVPALTILVACVIGVQLLNLALLVRSSTPQRIVAVVLILVLVLSSAVVGVCGLVGWITFVQQDSPFDDLAGITLVPLMAQTIFGFLVALGAIIYVWLYLAQTDVLAVADAIDRWTA